MAKMTISGHDLDYLKKMAKSGAESTLHRLREEIAVIERTFPELATAQGRSKIVASVEKGASNMTSAGRKAVSDRMKKYWAERRKQAPKGKK